MSGSGMEDMWLWDSRGKRAYKEGRLTNVEENQYIQIAKLRTVAICSECSDIAQYRYAPHDGAANWPECDRWRCERHKPYDATDAGWNGEWDYYEFM